MRGAFADAQAKRLGLTASSKGLQGHQVELVPWNPVQHTHAIVGCHMRHTATSLHHGRIDAHTAVRALLLRSASTNTSTSNAILLGVIHHLLLLRLRLLVALTGEVLGNRNRLCGRGGIRVEASLLLCIIGPLAEAVSGNIHNGRSCIS
jgi:hypothetical protein